MTPVPQSDQLGTSTQVKPSTGLDELRDTLKWLIASAAAAAAVLIATLQLKGFGQLAAAGPLRQAAAAVAAAVALGTILFVVVGGARVLATPRLSVHDLADRELKAGGVTLTLRLEPLKDRLVQDVLEQRSYLLDGSETIADFYKRYLASMSVRAAVIAGNRADLAGRHLDGAVAADRELVEIIAAQNEAKVERLEAKAQFLEAQRRFEHLIRRFPLGGFVFVVAVIAFALLIPSPTSNDPVSRPTPVSVYLKAEPVHYGFPESCDKRQLNGIAVGGTFENPIIITEEAAGCPARVLESSDLVAVPSLSP